MKQQHECGCGCQGVDRRSALARLFYGALGLLGLSAIAGCPGGSSYGRTASTAATQVTTVRQPDHLEFDKRSCRFGQALELELNGVKLLAAHNKDSSAQPRWVAVDRRCTHNRCLVSYDGEANEFVCPCHGSRFSFAGDPVSGPARLPLKTYRIEEGQINVSVYAEPPLLTTEKEPESATQKGR